MIAAVVNAVVVVLGGLIGLLFGGRLQEAHTKTIVAGLGICVMVIGITSAIETSNILIVILCIALGTVLGELLRIEDRLDSLGDWLKARLGRHGGSRFTEGFVTVTFAATMGVGVLFSGASVLLYQGALTLLAALVEPLLSPEVIVELSAVGGVMLIGTGINILGLAPQRLKVGNMLPAMVLPVVWFAVSGWFGG